MRFALLLAFLFLGSFSIAQTNAPPVIAGSPKPSSPVKFSHSAMTAAELQKTVDQLTQSNRDLLDLLKKQQAVLEDMQYDRRLQSRQIDSLEERLEDSLFQNTKLQNKIDSLEAVAAVHPIETPANMAKPDGTISPTPSSPDTTASPAPAPVADATPPPPSSYLPPPEPQDAPPGTKSWHRLFTLKGDDNRQTDLFSIQGRTWRVLWHNQDKPEKVYANTSALFVNAFPKDDTIPQKVCSKLGTGGDSAELDGPGNYYLKIEASGGSWELAVEDFR